MKNIKRIIVILIIASTSLSLAAQSTFGIVGGLNLSKFNISKTDGLEYEFGPGFDAGLFFRFQAGKHFYIQPDVIYSIKTTDMVISNPTLFISDSNQAQVITHKMHSIDVPVHIGLVFGKKTNFRIFAGPRFGFAVNVKYFHGKLAAAISAQDDLRLILLFLYGGGLAVRNPEIVHS